MYTTAVFSEVCNLISSKEGETFRQEFTKLNKKNNENQLAENVILCYT